MIKMVASNLVLKYDMKGLSSSSSSSSSSGSSGNDFQPRFAKNLMLPVTPENVFIEFKEIL